MFLPSSFLLHVQLSLIRSPLSPPPLPHPHPSLHPPPPRASYTSRRHDKMWAPPAAAGGAAAAQTPSAERLGPPLRPGQTRPPGPGDRPSAAALGQCRPTPGGRTVKLKLRRLPPVVNGDGKDWAVFISLIGKNYHTGWWLSAVGKWM